MGRDSYNIGCKSCLALAHRQPGGEEGQIPFNIQHPEIITSTLTLNIIPQFSAGATLHLSTAPFLAVRADTGDSTMALETLLLWRTLSKVKCLLLKTTYLRHLTKIYFYKVLIDGSDFWKYGANIFCFLIVIWDLQLFVVQ